MAVAPNVEIKCPICGAVNWLDVHDPWECIGRIAEIYDDAVDALEGARDVLSRVHSFMEKGDVACPNEDCPWENSHEVDDLENDAGGSLGDLITVLKKIKAVR
jgi:hypothetical protein